MRALASPTEFDDSAIGHVAAPSFSSRRETGGWRAVALCGRGGTAEVWRAVARDGRREAALKILRPELQQRTDARARLRGEFALLRAVVSPALVTPLELVELDDGPALALEYLPNGDLVSLLGAPARHWLPALRAVVAALTDLHAYGVAHGDLKARNVLFARDRRARVIDLTAARAVDAPAARSTAAYSLPPGMSATARAADCFALAVLMHELATAQLPYGAEGPASLGDIRPAATSLDPQAARLVAAAELMLVAGGGLPQGLSYFADVIESVGAVRA
jgi:eukaryotic-like serine/threonine-protein kinase